MAQKLHFVEQIIAKLREIEKLQGQGISIPTSRPRGGSVLSWIRLKPDLVS